MSETQEKSVTEASTGHGSPRRRLQALSQEKRAKLLDPAQQEFIENGYNKASLNTILRTAGMSKGQAYYYMKNKADLYRSVCERAFAGLIKAIAASGFNPTSAPLFWSDIHALFGQVIMALNQDDKLAALGRGVYESAEAQAALSVPLAKLYACFYEHISLGQELGAIRDDLPRDLIAATLVGAMRAIDQWFANNLTRLPESEALQINEKIIGMLQAFAAPVGLPSVEDRFNA